MQQSRFFRQGQTGIQQNANRSCNSAQTYLTLSHVLPADKLITLSGLKCRCFSRLFTTLVATIMFLDIPTIQISFWLWGESLSREQLLPNCSYPTECYSGLVLVHSAVCKVSIYQWFLYQWFERELMSCSMMWSKAVSFYLSYKDEVAIPVLGPEKWYYSAPFCHQQEVACEPLECIGCWFRNTLKILTILTVKNSFFKEMWMRAYNWKRGRFLSSLVPHFICGNDLPSGEDPGKKAQKCVCRGACWRSVECKHVLCSIHTLISNYVLQQKGFYYKIL